jgi:hypothetical protein
MRWTQPLLEQEAQTPARQPGCQPPSPPQWHDPRQRKTQPRGPREEDRGTTTVPASDFAPARAPAPEQTDAEAEDPCNGAERDAWTEDNPYGRGLQAPRLPHPESLCWRCGVTGHSRGDCRALSVLFCSLRDNGAAVQRVPVPPTPGRSPPTSRRPPLPEHPGVPGTPDNPGASAVPTVRPPPPPTLPPPPLSPTTTGDKRPFSVVLTEGIFSSFIFSLETIV